MKAIGILLRASLCAMGVVTLVACGTTGPGAEEGATELYSNDQVGDAPLPGLVRIAAIDRSTLESDGTVRYRLENLTANDVSNLTARVVFYYPATEETSSIALPFVTDVTDETEFKLFGGEDYEIVATSREFAERSAAGETILATRIDVEEEKPIALTARDGGNAGTRLMKGRLECVAISPEDARLGMDGVAPELWVDFRNVDAQSVRFVQFSAVFMDTRGDAIVSTTEWTALPTLAPGDVGRVEFDLSEVGAVRNLPFLVRARVKRRVR